MPIVSAHFRSLRFSLRLPKSGLTLLGLGFGFRVKVSLLRSCQALVFTVTFRMKVRVKIRPYFHDSDLVIDLPYFGRR